MINQRLNQLRDLMRQHKIHAYIVPTADPHLSEHLPEHWQARQWLSGFTGSAGTLVVTADQAALWTDSRYWEQAAHQLANSHIILQKQGIMPEPADWLAQNLPNHSRVAVAADMLSWATQKRFQAAFSAKNIELNTQIDLLTDLWTERDALPDAPVFAHASECVYQNSTEKLARIREFMRKKQADYHLISSLDDIAWLTNLRGNDVPYNPVFLAYLLISATHAILFADANKFGETEKKILNQSGIELNDYHQIVNELANISGSLLIDANKTAVSTLAKLPNNVELIEDINPSSLFKAQKSAEEIAHIRQAMREDGAALCGFFAELEYDLIIDKTITEWDIGERLTAHRSKRPLYISPSFGTIAGFGENGAQPHYAATPDSHSVLKGNGLLLIDSGAQYHNGTTDITRVMAIGTASDAEKRDFTLVLKAHIALASAVFPENLSAAVLDAICRAPMWQAQCDYGHGTGHGVGYCLNVHEFPASIAYRAAANPHNILKVGQLISNEPAIYRSGGWGIRIENLVVCQPVSNPQETAFGKFLRFETVTLCPIDTRLIIKELLTSAECDWLNTYHADVREKLSPLVDGKARDWLIERTQKI